MEKQLIIAGFGGQGGCVCHGDGGDGGAILADQDGGNLGGAQINSQSCFHLFHPNRVASIPIPFSRAANRSRIPRSGGGVPSQGYAMPRARYLGRAMWCWRSS